MQPRDYPPLPRRFRRKRLLVIGCGDVGQRLARLVCSHWKVYGVARAAETLERVRAAGAVPLAADAPRRRFEQLAHLVVLAAPPGSPPDAPGQTARPRERVDRVTRRLAARLLRGSTSGRPARLVYLSTTGVYGNRAGRWTDETTPLAPTTARALRRAAAERWLRRAAAASGRLRVSVLRVPGIYAPDRLPLARLVARIPALRREDDVMTNHIHADDLARLIRVALLRAPAQRVYNVVDDTGLPMGDHLDAVAAWAGLPLPPRLGRTDLLERVSPVRASFMTESRRIANRRMKRELRIRLRYPTVADFLAATPRPPEADRPVDIMGAKPV